MKLPFTICYTSKSHPDLTADDIKEIFAHASVKNNECEVRGILLHAFGNFFQVLEGNKKHLLDLYENKIKKDPRHTDIFEVYKKKSAKLVFTQYNSNFQVLEKSEELENIKEYLESNKNISTTSEKLSRLLKPFIILED